MSTGEFTTRETAWCPGCGNFGILKTLQGVLTDMGKKPREVLLVAGIGQAAKLPQYLSANAFCGLHGRALPPAVAAKIANESLTVIVSTGDGDTYGEGGNHFLHNIRRNVDIAHFVHDNRVYGLTKGQVSPTTDACGPDSSGLCNMNEPFNPLLIALAAGATFVARSFSGDGAHLAATMKAAIAHKGYALVDILQPCVSFNKVNTFAWYKERVYPLPETYDATSRLGAMEKAMEWGDKIPLGIFYKVEHPTFHAKNSVLSKGGPLIDRKHEPKVVEKLCREFV